MSIRERGIGNMPFIAVLILFVVCLAFSIIAKDEADTLKSSNAALRKDNTDKDNKVVEAENAYDALLEKTGLTAEELVRKGGVMPKPDAIRAAVQAFLTGVSKDMAKSGECTLSTKHYTVPQGAPAQETKGEDVLIKFYVQGQSDDTLTVKGLVDSIPRSLALAATIASENNTKFTTEVDAYRKRVDELAKANAASKTSYTSDIASKQAALETTQGDLATTRDNVRGLTDVRDQMESELATAKQEAAKSVRLAQRETAAWKGRVINEKEKKAIAMAEDPKDGEILVASDTFGTVWINLGRQHKVSAGQKFTVWRAGKGNVREDVAMIRVLSVEQTRAEARIIKESGVSVVKGMNISNPFYSPTDTLRVHISGDLKRYTTDTAKARLAASGVTMVDRLDDTVQIIVLGEPPVEVSDGDGDDPAVAERKAKLARDKRLDEVIEKARAIGAIVVTEDVLATFVEW